MLAEPLLDALQDLGPVVAGSSVATAPGSTSATRTWRLVTSWRSDSLKAPTACLVAL